MNILFTKKEYQLAKSTQNLPCKCYNCNNIFFVMKKQIMSKT